jgi:hypothetical protein
MIILALLLTACETWPWQKTPTEPVAQMDPLAAKDTKEPYEAPVAPQPGLALSTEQRFKDIPLPVGLKEDLDRTFVYESGALQVGRMVYTSRASVSELAQFFINQCPAAGWSLKKVIEAEGGKSLLYSKAGKRLEVVVQSLTVTQGRRVTITLTPDTESEGGL